MSRVFGMLKKNALTKRIALAEFALEAAEGNCDQALSSLGDSTADEMMAMLTVTTGMIAKPLQCGRP